MFEKNSFFCLFVNQRVVLWLIWSLPQKILFFRVSELCIVVKRKFFYWFACNLSDPTLNMILLTLYSLLKKSTTNLFRISSNPGQPLQSKKIWNVFDPRPSQPHSKEIEIFLSPQPHPLKKILKFFSNPHPAPTPSPLPHQKIKKLNFNLPILVFLLRGYFLNCVQRFLWHLCRTPIISWHVYNEPSFEHDIAYFPIALKK